MGTMYISEYKEIGQGEYSHGVQVPVEGEDTVYQAITTSGAAAPSAAFSPGKKLVCITVTTACFLTFGETPVAVDGDNGAYIPANVPRCFAINAGMKVSAIE